MSMSAPFILSSSQPVSFSKRIAWITLTVVMAMLLRIPLWIHGTDSLDSDAACNGLMLKWMSEGQGGWHLPGIHYMGVTEIILALPAAWCFGVNTYTLISGPVIAFGLYVGATYGLVNLLYGHQTAIRALLADITSIFDDFSKRRHFQYDLNFFLRGRVMLLYIFFRNRNIITLQCKWIH